MNENSSIYALDGSTTRRQMIIRAGIGFGSLTLSSVVWGQEATKEKPATAANRKRTSLHQDVELSCAPQRIYDALLDSKQFATFSGQPADIDPKAGGAFSMFGGMIAGRSVELISGERIVQAWRPTHWDAGIYSLVKFELKAQGSGTLVALEHKGFPEGDYDSLSQGWTAHYWEPMKKFFA